MTQYAITDIGSNTMVLIFYEIHDGVPIQMYHESTPAHLIDYVDADRIMSKEGIAEAARVLALYDQKCETAGIEYRFADITGPCRIGNQQELVDALAKTKFEIHPLTGYQEAAYDYIGTRFSYPDVRDGIAFDVGGGSTELISFRDSKPVDAVSFHLGCVRLSHLPLDTQECAKELHKIRKEYPSLNTASKDLIGIGGTMRYAGLVCNDLYHTDHMLPVVRLREMYQRLLDHEAEAEEAVMREVRVSRQPLLLPGIHMILEICNAYEAETILISDTGIRDGFLLECLHLTNGQENA